ncbi:MAG: hypothetical protein ACRC7S_17850 [Cetobacterium sp.]
MEVKIKYKSGFYFSHECVWAKYDCYRDKLILLIDNEVLKSMNMSYLSKEKSDKKHSKLTIDTAQLKSLKFGETEILEKNIIKRYFRNVSRNVGIFRIHGVKVGFFEKILLGFERDREF